MSFITIYKTNTWNFLRRLFQKVGAEAEAVPQLGLEHRRRLQGHAKRGSP